MDDLLTLYTFENGMLKVNGNVPKHTVKIIKRWADMSPEECLATFRSIGRSLGKCEYNGKLYYAQI